MVNYTDLGTSCGRCHGNPPASVTASHNGKAATYSCVQCHGAVVDGNGNIVKIDTSGVNIACTRPGPERERGTNCLQAASIRTSVKNRLKSGTSKWGNAINSKNPP